MNNKWLIISVASIFGLLAMILPVLIFPPAYWYDAPLFPVVRNAVEHVGREQLVLLFAVGIVLGFLSKIRPLVLGGASISLLPLTAIAEMAVDPTSHNLFPLEFMVYGFYGCIVAIGVLIAQRIRSYIEVHE
jgi:hypothetical protein